MPVTLQSFFVGAIPKAKADMLAAMERLPEDKRGWSPEAGSRSALNQAAECAILNGYTADVVESKQWTFTDFEGYGRERDALAGKPEDVKAMLDRNTDRVIAAIAAVKDEDMSLDITTPFGTMTMAQICSYPYWNMCYHEGQINYIASMLGCLD